MVVVSALYLLVQLVWALSVHGSQQSWLVLGQLVFLMGALADLLAAMIVAVTPPSVLKPQQSFLGAGLASVLALLVGVVLRVGIRGVTVGHLVQRVTGRQPCGVELWLVTDVTLSVS